MNSPVGGIPGGKDEEALAPPVSSYNENIHVMACADCYGTPSFLQALSLFSNNPVIPVLYDSMQQRKPTKLNPTALLAESAQRGFVVS